MQKFKLNTKTVIYISFYAVLALDAFVVLPLQVQKIFKVKAQAADLKKKITFFEREAVLEVSLFDEKVKINKEIADKESKIAPLSDTAAISVFISRTAKETSFDAQEIIMGKLQGTQVASTESKFFYLPVRITGRAGFHNLAQFFNTLENGPYSFQVKDFSIREGKPYHEIGISLAALLRE